MRIPWGDFDDGDTIALEWDTFNAAGGLDDPDTAFVAGDFDFRKDGSAIDVSTGVTYTNIGVGRHKIELDTGSDADVTDDAKYVMYYATALTGSDVDGRNPAGVAIGTFSLGKMQKAADEALVGRGLDHLLNAAVVGADVTDNSIFARLVSKEATADWDDFVNTTDSLQAIRDTAPLGTAMRGTDSALLASSAPTNFGDLAITATTGRVDVGEWLGSAVPALVGGRLDVSVGAMAAGVITSAAFGIGAIDASAIATNAIGSDELATDAITSTQFAASAAQKVRDEIMPTQNAAFNNIGFIFVAASDGRTPVTGATGTSVERSIDGGAFGAGTGTLNEVANGAYSYDASAADMNGGIIIFRFSATGGTPGAPDDVFLVIVTGGGV